MNLRSTCSASRPTWSRSSSSPQSTGALGGRGCRLRVRHSLQRSPRRDVRWRLAAQLPPAQIDHDGRGRDDHDNASDELAEGTRGRCVTTARRAPITRATSGAGLVPAFGLDDHLGFNFRMTDFQGALGCCADGSRPGSARRARDTCSLWATTTHSQRLDWLDTPLVPEGYDHGYQAYVCLFRPGGALASRMLLGATGAREAEPADGAGLEENGGSRPARGRTPPRCRGLLRARSTGLRPEGFPNAALAEGLSLTLPLYAQMTEDEHATVVPRPSSRQRRRSSRGEPCAASPEYSNASGGTVARN